MGSPEGPRPEQPEPVPDVRDEDVLRGLIAEGRTPYFHQLAPLAAHLRGTEKPVHCWIPPVGTQHDDGYRQVLTDESLDRVMEVVSADGTEVRGRAQLVPLDREEGYAVYSLAARLTYEAKLPMPKTGVGV